MIPVPRRMLIAMSRHAKLMVALRGGSSVVQRHPRGQSKLFSSTAMRKLSGNFPRQAQSPLAPIGVSAALAKASSKVQSNENEEKLTPKIFDEFALKDRVGIVSGGNRGLGLEIALALCEAGARAIYCLDLPGQPSEEWRATRAYLEEMDFRSRIEYVSVDVTDQEQVWNVGREIGNREGRMDVCVAAAGILRDHTDCLRYPAKQFKEVLDVNTNGVLYTAQAAGQQMERFGNGGSIILVASMSGTITNKDHAWVSYNTSKSAVLQMARSMACELGAKNIRVNSLSPGHIYTSMTAAYLEEQPHLLEKWSKLNPMGRIGRPDEMRGVCVWLASDASSFCTGSDIIVSGGHHSW